MEGPVPGRSSASCLAKECSLGLPAWLFLRPREVVGTHSPPPSSQPLLLESFLLFLSPPHLRPCLQASSHACSPSMSPQLGSSHAQQSLAPKMFKDLYLATCSSHPLLLRRTSALPSRANISLMSAESPLMPHRTCSS